MQLIQYLPFVAAALGLGVVSQTGEAGVTSRIFYTTNGCGGTPDFMEMQQTATCFDASCGTSVAYNVPVLSSISCSTDQYTHAAFLFGSVPYVLADQYADENCQVYTGFSSAMRANEDCVPTSAATSRTMLLNANGTVTSTVYLKSNNCDKRSVYVETLYDPSNFKNSICEKGKLGNFVYYNTAYPSPHLV
ncbi:hypothetical protein PHYSODRAFT_261751 [Phytophthora sojae]|uniref:TKL protein kinase n=1 Tax=Phytophthora sojae (strain P6497) TaxID=1094619 RepID=G5A1E5_PHYSP|nr:hypothetical protein PHYSODRAFT_261751 [Phytophthora sojae]EGZ10744.1 hypothetical protein PHYSODRAFT_261751 [Phytophthora sojae]|eukprot:XP_009533489.1 hypothetical protein PHYSODRAFT_261751 [Phytophthora sojae]